MNDHNANSIKQVCCQVPFTIGIKIKKALGSFDKRWLDSFFISAIIFLALNIVTYAKFDSCIDYIQQGVLFNISGNNSTAHTVFSNILLTYIVGSFTRLLPGIAWYTWLLEVTSFGGVFILTSIYFYYHKSKMSRIVAVVFNVFVGYECYMCPGHMKSAIVLAFSMSLLVMIYALSEGIIYCFLGPLLGLVIAGLLTRRGLLIGLIMGGFVFATHLILNYRWNKRACLSMLTFVAAMGIVFSLWLVNDKVFYENDNLDWSLALSVDDSMEKLDVLGYPDYNEDWQENFNLSKSQYDAIKNGTYYIISPNNMNFLNEIASKSRAFTSKSTLKFFRTVPICWIKVWVAYLWIFAAFLFLQSKSDKKKLIMGISAVYIFVVYFSAYMFYAWDNRVIQVAAFVPAAFLLFINTYEIRGVDVRELIVVLILMGVVMYNSFSGYIVTSVTHTEMSDQLEDYYSYGDVYALDLNMLLKGYSAYKPYDMDLLKYSGDLLVMNGQYGIYPMYVNYMLYMVPTEEVHYMDGTVDKVYSLPIVW